jgi:addiction module RelE/StbE family toxin
LVQIVWSRRAIADLEAIRRYIGQFNPLAAQRMVLRLRAAALGLHEHPERGRLANPPVRELTIVAPYVIRYVVVGAQVAILRVKHGAQAPE